MLPQVHIILKTGKERVKQKFKSLKITEAIDLKKRTSWSLGMPLGR